MQAFGNSARRISCARGLGFSLGFSLGFRVEGLGGV